ncbi:MAG: complex I NDUFA9 subunit family protein, partial [gamma proteobacterium symbiont of Bathyaustriella thionipta]|nr:complex I NDUFA9 subunit family protein [gamma proteobacterium symbiont of Bathyaustriella thionipta]MCU7951558.1 complex I NDUFA9 subunit family protein [gamma proteobacterium symbiont of Bathyaustriella thionipta]MCU7968754.1 complex I NDUFA9 subunit family protein [gamma proteobacterium symbiont of Bathyaustriella thionipta]
MKICVIGGTGFVGTHLITKLVSLGHSIKVITRRPERHRHLTILPGVKIVSIDFFGNKILERQIDTYDVVINLAGILNPEGKNSFAQVHEKVAIRIAEATKAVGTPRLLHMSALNADEKAPSEYLRSKGRAQKELLAIDGLNVTTFSPSVIFGAGDSFFNRFAQLLSIMPGYFPLTCANARFAPVYIGDVVDAFINSIDNPDTFAKNYDLCGPEAFSLRELVNYTARQTNSHCVIIPLNNFFSKPLAMFMGLFPGAPITVDNYKSMLVDSVCSNAARNASANELVPRHISFDQLNFHFNSGNCSTVSKTSRL